jgi:cell division protein ZapA (FtsZ GTPase activity inhibitor)
MVKNRVKVSICDISYSLIGDEDESHVFRAAAYVDSAMRTVLEAGIAEREKAAVLVALQLASKVLKGEEFTLRQTEESQRLLEKIEREIHLLVGPV